jgi:signal transduction histidine kinase
MVSIHSRRTAALVAFVTAAIVILNLALWLLYRNTRSNLEMELARRLENVAQVLGSTLDTDLLLDAWLLQSEEEQEASSRIAPDRDDSALVLLRAQLVEIADATNLANITLYDPDAHAFVDVASVHEGTLVNDPLYRAEVRAALTGSPAHTPLYRSGEEYLMSGYAPVAGDIPFAVGVEAGALYFAGLQRQRNTLWVVAAISVVGLIAIGIFHARVQSRLARAEAAVQRSETLAAMGRMAAGVAHEIRNPLGIIRATASRLKKRYDDPTAPDEKFDYIAEEVDRLDGVLGGYLGFARDEPARLEPLELTQVIRRTLKLMQPELEAAGVRLDAQLPEPCMVRGDSQRLQQMIMNLVLNGVQAMPEGGVLQVSVHCAAGHATLRFVDNGPGIPIPLRERVFEPFFTTKERGSGLGLVIVRRIVEQHAGAVALETADNGGARIDIRLPMV